MSYIKKPVQLREQESVFLCGNYKILRMPLARNQNEYWWEGTGSIKSLAGIEAFINLDSQYILI
jgi:hypothetical protein